VDNNYPTLNPDAVAVFAGQFRAVFADERQSFPDGAPIVGLPDTYVDPDISCNLKGYVLPGISVAGKAAPANGTPTHGTAMAETIVRAAGGNVKILPVDVYGPNATTTTFDVANGIYQAVNAGANPINLSLGSSGDSAFLHYVITQAHKQGVAFFAAAAMSR